MSRAKASIIKPDRRIAVQIDTLCHLFDVSPTTIDRAVAAGKLTPSRELGPVLYSVEDVEKLLFSGDIRTATPAASEDSSVAAINAKTNRINGTAAGRA
jgi:hypothetical protein